MIICTVYKGEKRVLASQCFLGLHEKQFEESLSFIINHLSSAAQNDESNKRLEIPEEALRAALLNAIIHRDYKINKPIQIFVYRNRIEIVSPGCFVYPITKSNMFFGISYDRNSSIAQKFRELRYSLRMGIGLKNIFYSYAEWGLEKPQIIEGEDFILCVLPRSKKL